jgi:hypothetical protein
MGASCRVESVPKLRAKLPALRAQLSDRAFFRGFFIWLFDFSKNKDSKSLQLDVATETIQMVMTKDMFSLVDLWVEFLKV